MQELADKVWGNQKFHELSKNLELSWLRRELNSPDSVPIETASVVKLVKAAAILACSDHQTHRLQAFRTATWAYDVARSDELPINQALRVVLARLGNFPSFQTRADVSNAQSHLPLAFAQEEIAAAEARKIVIGEKPVYLTNFQFDLWKSLSGRQRIAVAAPTSAGKSFVLQNYLLSLFAGDAKKSVVYIVPTRALITQVSGDLASHFKESGAQAPEIITVPLEADAPLPAAAIYVMTQERLQLTMTAQPAFAADVLVVDEAHSVSELNRGVLLQWVVDDLLSRNKEMQVLFASPGIRNLGVFGSLFNIDNIVPFSSIEPTVAQNFMTVSVDVPSKGHISVSAVREGIHSPLEISKFQLNHPLINRSEKLVHISHFLSGGQSSIVYANGAAEAETVAIQLAELNESEEPTQEQLALADLAKEAVHSEYALAECVRHGVGFHYSNIPTQLRHAVEKAVSQGHLKYLTCTSTLLQGVNLPTKNIFMFMPEKGRGHPLESTDFWNLSGRAGRLRREFQGNIFLIDYDKWKSQPLSGPRESEVIPAIETTIKVHQQALFDVISNAPSASKQDRPDLETTFARLYSDLKKGDLSATLQRIGIATNSSEAMKITEALQYADTQVALPSDILNRSPNISAHKQQRLYEHLATIIGNDKDAAKTLIPRHPRESSAWQSYSNALEICHDIILGRDTTKNLHKFHALMALKWMQGLPLPQIIDEQIGRNKTKSSQAVIRETLDLIETKIRFEAVRLFGCYNSLLIYALNNGGFVDLVSTVPSLPLYLEVGASDKTMISFVSLGLSRVTAMKLNVLSARKDMDAATALNWLRRRPLASLGLSPLLLAEVNEILSK